MARIDFYITPYPTINACYPIVCRLVEKAYKQAHHVYIHASSEEAAQQLDLLLWTFRDTSFVPHTFYREGGTPSPIQIGFDATPSLPHDILINLCLKVPAFYAGFQRVIEFVPTDPAWREELRQHFKLYREQGCELQSHDLSQQKASHG